MASLAAYGGAFVIGLTLVSFPASSAFFQSMHSFSDAQYGAIYIPQLVAAIAGAVLGGALSNLWGLKKLYLASLLFFLAAQALLAASGSVNASIALPMIMAATACFGFGFGFGGGPLNGIVAALYPRARNSAITALHMTAGAGLTVAPFYFSYFASRGHWSYAPFSLLALTSVLVALTARAPLPTVKQRALKQAAALPGPARTKYFWILAFAAIAYALVEGTFSNWAVIYAQDDLGLSAGAAALCLTSFWAMLTIGRLGASLLAIRVRPIAFLIAMPIAMTGALFALRSAASPLDAVLGFGLAGAACSAFFPMLVGFAADPFPEDVSWIAAMLTAALMVGVGIGSFVVGSLRGATPIRELYIYALGYPAAALLSIALATRVRPHRHA